MTGGAGHPWIVSDSMDMAEFSILDLSPIPEGSDAAAALRNSVDLARHAERWGYRRYWVAEASLGDSLEATNAI